MYFNFVGTSKIQKSPKYAKSVHIRGLILMKNIDYQIVIPLKGSLFNKNGQRILVQDITFNPKILNNFFDSILQAHQNLPNKFVTFGSD